MTSYVAPTVPAVGDAITAAQGDILANNWLSIGGAWTPYTPVLTGASTNPTLGTGSTASGRFMQIGAKTIIGNALIIFGTSGASQGGGTYTLSLPVSPLTTQTVVQFGMGKIKVAGLWTLCYLNLSGYGVNLQYFNGIVNSSVVNAGSGAPGVWTNNDLIETWFSYEAA